MLSRAENSYAKIQLWALTKYAKVVYLDADTMARKSIDVLFKAELPNNCAHDGQDETMVGIRAAPDIFGGVFNSGVMVLKPSALVVQAMLRVYRNVPSYNKGDQGFFNVFWANCTALLPPE